jgi:peptide/nickel transport system permease protein/peptide/nickel transport system substrate-binding protein
MSSALTWTRRSVLATALAGIAASSAASLTRAFAQQAGTGVLRVVYQAEPTSFDPTRSTGGDDYPLLYPVYDTLIGYNPADLTPVPALAESWEWASPTTLHLKLRSGVTFHDGAPFDAEAVRVNLDRARTQPSALAGDLTIISAVSVVDPMTVAVELTRPEAGFVLYLADKAGMMVSPLAAQDPEALKRMPVGAGPYKLANWATGQSLEYVANETYWREGEPKLAGLRFSVVSDPTARLRALQAGDADFLIGLSPRDVAALESDPNFEVTASGTLAYYKIWLNLGAGPFANADVRRAMNMAIDRDAILKGLAQGLGETASEIVPSAHWAFSEQAANKYPYDPEAAKALLAQAGYPTGFEFGIASLAGSDYQRLAEALQSYFAAVGITMNINQFQSTDYVDQFFNKKAFPAGLAQWTGRVDPSMTVIGQWSPTAFFNVGKYDNPELMGALAAAGEASDLDARAEAFRKVVDIVATEALDVPIYFDPGLTARRKQVQGFTPNIYGRPRFDNISLE